MFRQPFLLLVSLLLTSCGLSSTVAVSPNHPTPLFGRAVVAFSVAIDAPWPFKGFEVQLDKYDLEKQDTSGGCFWFERVSDLISPAKIGSKKYFAFLVPAGAYFYSPFNGTTLEGPPRAFLAPAGQVTYIGDFAYVGTRSGLPARNDQVIEIQDRVVSLNTNLPAAEQVLRIKLSPAKVIKVQPAQPFLCTP